MRNGGGAIGVRWRDGEQAHRASERPRRVAGDAMHARESDFRGDALCVCVCAAASNECVHAMCDDRERVARWVFVWVAYRYKTINVKYNY